VTGFTFDQYDVEWEHPDTGRTVWLGRDDYCDVCDGEIDENDHCDCRED
jgi:hypothetical protein